MCYLSSSDRLRRLARPTQGWMNIGRWFRMCVIGFCMRLREIKLNNNARPWQLQRRSTMGHRMMCSVASIQVGESTINNFTTWSCVILFPGLRDTCELVMTRRWGLCGWFEPEICLIHDVICFIGIWRLWNHIGLIFVVEWVWKEKRFAWFLRMRLILKVFLCQWSTSRSTRVVYALILEYSGRLLSGFKIHMWYLRIHICVWLRSKICIGWCGDS